MTNHDLKICLNILDICCQAAQASSAAHSGSMGAGRGDDEKQHAQSAPPLP